MLRVTAESIPTVAQRRIAPLDRARTLLTLLVVLHHSVVNYTYFGRGDNERWLGFDLVVLFNDSFFMAAMFFISGLFVCNSLTAKGAALFLRDRAIRLGIPFLVSILVLVPIAYYPSFLRYHFPGTTDFNFLHFWARTLTVGPWPSGPAWFLWVLLAFDALATALWLLAPRAIAAAGRWLFAARNRSRMLFWLFLAITALAYLPLRLGFGDAAWLEFGPVAVQTSRVLLYAAYFLCGMLVGATSLWVGPLAEAGTLARRWPLWAGLAMLFYGAILVLVYAHHNWVSFVDPPLWWSVGYAMAFVSFSAAMIFTLPAFLLRFTNKDWGLLDWMRPSAYGIFLLHYIFIVWTQYVLYDTTWPAGVKAAIVFTVTLSMSLLLTLALRKIPLLARVI
jgi:surface polysaccharide O-acyltransferase-like enzyme